MKNIVLFGPPGAGKGTQAALLKNTFELIHISTGDVFRENIKNKTELGVLAKSYIDAGNLIPDGVTIDMLQSEVKKTPRAKGFIFDGFPRTIFQAESLDNFLRGQKTTIHAMIALEVPEDVLVKRLLERGKISGRSDDTDEKKIRNRFKEYDQKTAPVKSFYEAQKKYYGIQGVNTIENIAKEIAEIIKML